MLSGFYNLTLSDNSSSLYVDLLQYNNCSYLLNVKRDMVAVDVLRILRLLINKSLMMNMTMNYTDLYCTTGTIVHLSDPN